MLAFLALVGKIKKIILNQENARIVLMLTLENIIRIIKNITRKNQKNMLKDILTLEGI